MNARDDFFYQAVVYAKEKNYRAARAMLRNLLFQYPDDIEGLLLYSIVAKNREGSIQALKRILQLDPDHEVAFSKLAKLKYAPPVSIPSPKAPLPIPNPTPNRVLSPVVELAPQPKTPEETISRKTLEPRKTIEPRSSLTKEKNKKKISVFDAVLIGLFIFVCLCVSVGVVQQIIINLLSSF